MSEPPTLDLTDIDDYESLYHACSSVVPLQKTLILQNLQKLSKTDSLFYTNVTVDNGHVFNALVDSGSMACTISETVDAKLSQSTPDIEKKLAADFVIVGCGGHLVTPSAMYDLTTSVYGYKVVIPVLVVPGQTDEMILGSSAIKWLISQMKKTVTEENTASPLNSPHRMMNCPISSLCCPSQKAALSKEVSLCSQCLNIWCGQNCLHWMFLQWGVQSSSNPPNARPDLLKFWWGELSLPYGEMAGFLSK